MKWKFSIVETERLDRIESQLIKINQRLKMNFQELADQLDALAAQLNKALGEIQTEIANIGNVPQSIIDKLDAAKAVAQQLDDLNPDAPPPQP